MQSYAVSLPISYPSLIILKVKVIEEIKYRLFIRFLKSSSDLPVLPLLKESREEPSKKVHVCKSLGHKFLQQLQDLL